MEAKGAGSVGEVRRLHIIYFLSRRMGRIDHPHLIRVNHLTRNGVYLRDIKRWLADLRGKDMPEAFAWSYKRKYQTGYVWQDLLDDDLITPISDNEYVLKGSEIISSPLDPPLKSYAEKKSCLLKEQSVKVEFEPPINSKEEAFQIHQHPKNIDIQAKVVSSEINQESPHSGSERSTLTREFDEMKSQAESHSGSAETLLLTPNTNSCQQSDKSQTSSFYSNFLLKRKNKNKYYKDKDAKEMASTTSSSSSSSSSTCSNSSSHQSPSAKGTSTNSNSSGSSNIFRNLISCGAVDTNDAVLVKLNRANKTTSNKSACSNQDIIKADPIGKAYNKPCGSAGVFGTCRNLQEQPGQPQKNTTASRNCHDGEKGWKKQQKEDEFTSQKAASAAYRPVAGPHCSQCRKLFKPEKLHSHMKSCRGMKAIRKTATASAENIPEMGSRTSTCEESASAYFLTS